VGLLGPIGVAVKLLLLRRMPIKVDRPNAINSNPEITSINLFFSISTLTVIPPSGDKGYEDIPGEKGYGMLFTVP